MIVCKYGHLRAPDNQTGCCRRCAREREAARRKADRAAIGSTPRKAPPPVIQVPAPAYRLTREELAKERAESRERTALVLDAAIERSRIREANQKSKKAGKHVKR